MRFKRVLISGDAIVVAFDICSSSDMLEELILRSDIRPYEYVIRELKHHLAKAQESVLFDPYKFTGDGWILLFPANTSGVSLWSMLTELSLFYRATVEEHLLPRLNIRPKVNGLTFGIDFGPVAKMTIFQQTEYVGRAITVACRLQSAVGTLAKENASFKALISATAFSEYFAQAGKIRSWNKTVPLRNIRDGRGFSCKLVHTLPTRARKRAISAP
jgi:hypothetical protein